MNPGAEPADTRVSPQQEPRLPPGQVATDKWPVLHYGSVPRVDLSRWDLRIHGLVERAQRWSWDEFRSLPRVQVRYDPSTGAGPSRAKSRDEALAERL